MSTFIKVAYCLACGKSLGDLVLINKVYCNKQQCERGKPKSVPGTLANANPKTKEVTYRPLTNVERECKFCEKKFITKHYRHTYCSQKCSRLANGQTNLQEQGLITKKGVINQRINLRPNAKGSQVTQDYL